MTNREKLNKTNIFDLLMKINEGIFDEVFCVRDAIEGKDVPCPKGKRGVKHVCEDCISAWLNEEV